MKKHEPDPRKVAARLAELARLYVPETIDEARRRLAAERPQRATEPFAKAVERRLGELSALDDLARHLHRKG